MPTVTWTHALLLGLVLVARSDDTVCTDTSQDDTSDPPLQKQLKAMMCKDESSLLQMPLKTMKAVDNATAKVSDPAELTLTTPNRNNAYFVIPGRPPFRAWLGEYILKFAVKANNDAHVGLIAEELPETGEIQEPSTFYEFVIGGWANGRSVIRRSNQGRNEVTVQGSPLNSAHFNPFWISVNTNTGNVALGEGLVVGEDVLMQFTDCAVLTPVDYALMSGWGSSAEWQVLPLPPFVERSTPNRNNAYFVIPERPRPPFEVDGSEYILKFAVKATNDAHVGLMAEELPETGEIQGASAIYEFVIGGWSNGQSVIRRSNQGHNEVTVQGSPLNSEQFNPFWITVNTETGVVALGEGMTVSENVLMQFTDQAVRTPVDYAVMSGWGNTAEWQVLPPNSEFGMR